MFEYTLSPEQLTIGKDLDLRETFHNTLYGTETEKPRGALIVIQELKRDDSGNPITSPYAYDTGEGSYKERGTATTRTGFLCDEYWRRSFIRPSGRLVMDEIGAPMGVFANERLIFYFSAHDPIRQHDVIIVPRYDENGNPESPVVASMEYNITIVYPKFLDGGRIEFYAAIAEIQK